MKTIINEYLGTIIQVVLTGVYAGAIIAVFSFLL